MGIIELIQRKKKQTIISEKKIQKFKKKKIKNKKIKYNSKKELWERIAKADGDELQILLNRKRN